MLIGGTSIIPFAEREFIYKQQENPENQRLWQFNNCLTNSVRKEARHS